MLTLSKHFHLDRIFFQYHMIWKIHQMYYSVMHNALILNLTLVCTRLPRVLFKFSWGFQIMPVILTVSYPTVQSDLIKSDWYTTLWNHSIWKFLRIFHENLGIKILLRWLLNGAMIIEYQPTSTGTARYCNLGSEISLPTMHYNI